MRWRRVEEGTNVVLMSGGCVLGGPSGARERECERKTAGEPHCGVVLSSDAVGVVDLTLSWQTSSVQLRLWLRMLPSASE